MSDFAFLRAGLGDGEHGESEDALKRTALAMLQMFMEDALGTAARFAAACGRGVVVARDVEYALKYECMSFFFDKPVEMQRARVRALLTRPDDDEPDARQAAEGDATSSEADARSDSDGPSDDGSTATTEGEADDELYSTEFACGDAKARALHRGVTTRVRAWESWRPTDPAHLFMKGVIESSTRTEDA